MNKLQFGTNLCKVCGVRISPRRKVCSEHELANVEGKTLEQLATWWKVKK